MANSLFSSRPRAARARLMPPLFRRLVPSVYRTTWLLCSIAAVWSSLSLMADALEDLSEEIDTSTTGWLQPTSEAHTQHWEDPGFFSSEQDLMHALVGQYEKSVRPVYDASQPVHIKLGLALTQILDLDEKNQVLTTNVWLEAEWYDERLRWNSSDFEGITSIRIPCEKIWLPDIVLYNSVDDYTSGYMPTLAMVYNDSRVFWGPVIRFRSSCKINITYFPFDDQVCRLKLGSWAYNGFQVNVWNGSDTMDLSNFVDNGEWELVGVKVRRNVVFYNCCDEPFPDVTFFVHLRRRVKYYFMNIIIPCIILSFLCLAGFLLPPESGEKITLGLSVLLTITVFMLMVADKMPQTSESISVISIYLMVVLATSCLSVLSSVVVLSIHHQRGRPRRVPRWLRFVVFTVVAKVVCIRTHTVASHNDHGDKENHKSGRHKARKMPRSPRKGRVATEEREYLKMEFRAKPEAVHLSATPSRQPLLPTVSASGNDNSPYERGSNLSEPSYRSGATSTFYTQRREQLRGSSVSFPLQRPLFPSYPAPVQRRSEPLILPRDEGPLSVDAEEKGRFLREGGYVFSCDRDRERRETGVGGCSVQKGVGENGRDTGSCFYNEERRGSVYGEEGYVVRGDAEKAHNGEEEGRVFRRRVDNDANHREERIEVNSQRDQRSNHGEGDYVSNNEKTDNYRDGQYAYNSPGNRQDSYREEYTYSSQENADRLHSEGRIDDDFEQRREDEEGSVFEVSTFCVSQDQDQTSEESFAGDDTLCTGDNSLVDQAHQDCSEVSDETVAMDGGSAIASPRKQRPSVEEKTSEDLQWSVSQHIIEDETGSSSSFRPKYSPIVANVNSDSSRNRESFLEGDTPGHDENQVSIARSHQELTVRGSPHSKKKTVSFPLQSFPHDSSPPTRHNPSENSPPSSSSMTHSHHDVTARHGSDVNWCCSQTTTTMTSESGDVMERLLTLVQGGQGDAVEDERLYREWHDVACVLDRLLFYVFLVITVVSAVAILEMRPGDIDF